MAEKEQIHDDVSAELIPAVILAGGEARRLRPLTDAMPKALVDVAGRPFLWHQLQLLKSQGIRRIVLAVGYLWEKIHEHFGDGSEVGMKIEYSVDGPVLLGTAGAIRQALPSLAQQFFVLYGDSYLVCNYRAVQAAFRNSSARGLMTIYRNDGQFDTSNVEFDGRQIVRYDKQHRTPAMRYIDYGLGVFDRTVFEAIPPGSNCDLAHVYQDLLRNRDLAAFEVYERFYEIGSSAGLRDTINFFRASGMG
jgi:NDP-sugar pyrophosphorylase family protein